MNAFLQVYLIDFRLQSESVGLDDSVETVKELRLTRAQQVAQILASLSIGAQIAAESARVRVLEPQGIELVGVVDQDVVEAVLHMAVPVLVRVAQLA